MYAPCGSMSLLTGGGFMAYTGEWWIGIYLTLALAEWTFLKSLSVQ